MSLCRSEERGKKKEKKNGMTSIMSFHVRIQTHNRFIFGTSTWRLAFRMATADEDDDARREKKKKKQTYDSREKKKGIHVCLILSHQKRERIDTVSTWHTQHTAYTLTFAYVIFISHAQEHKTFCNPASMLFNVYPPNSNADNIIAHSRRRSRYLWVYVCLTRQTDE